MLYGREAQYPINLFYPKPQGDPRLELGEVGAASSDKQYEVHSHAQLTMEKEQRRQKDYYQRKVHREGCKTGDRVWLLPSSLARQLRSIRSDKRGELSDLQARLPGKVAGHPFQSS